MIWNNLQNGLIGMDILNLFRECVYPSASIRTESLDSIDQPCPGHRFRACNINDHGEEMVYGEIQLTRTEIIFYRPGRFPTRWPIKFIRRYGCDEDGGVFSFESGRQGPTGEGIYAFRVEHASELISALRSVIDEAKQTQPENARITSSTSKVVQKDTTHEVKLELVPSGSDSTPGNNNKSDVKQINNDNNISTNSDNENNASSKNTTHDGPKILYTEIDFGMTKALSSSAAENASTREEIS